MLFGLLTARGKSLWNGNIEYIYMETDKYIPTRAVWNAMLIKLIS